MKSKECTKCKEIKPLSDFYKAKQYTWIEDGHDYYCKYCRNGNTLKSHRNKDKKPCSIEGCDRPHYAKTYCRPHYARLIRNGTTDPLWTPLTNTEKRYAEYKVKVHHPNGKTYEYDRLRYYNRKNYLKQNYNLDIEDYERMSKNGCQICKETAEVNLHVDHDHSCCPSTGSCGKCVRGVICPRCNMLVDRYERGKIRLDNPRLNKIIKYLDRYAKKRAKLDN